jgi:EpsD family peptidyl-prolyl cis-trans isomerase
MHAVTLREVTHAGFVALFMLASACTPAEPEGQVIAVVNGEEITIPEFNEEVRSRGLSIAEDPSARIRVVEDLVHRKLLVQAAKRQQLDRQPSYLLASRRASELLLADALIGPGGAAKQPSEQEVAGFIASRPWAFGQRVLFTVDRIVYAPVADERVRNSATAATSIADLERVLGGARVTRSRKTEIWDSARLPAGWGGKLLLSRQRPVFLEQSGAIVAAQVLTISKQPVSGPQAVEAAKQWIAAERREQRVARLVARAKEKADISYQPEFNPGNDGAQQ